MADALVSFIVEELGAIVKDEVGLLASVKKELKSLSGTFSAIQALLVDAERQQDTTEGVRDWLTKIKEVAYEVEDILDDEWRTDAFMSDIGQNQKVRSCSIFPCLCFKQVKSRHVIGHRIREVRERLNEISEEKSRFILKEVNTREVVSRLNKEDRETSPLIDESEIFGRDLDKEEIIRQLVSETGKQEKSVSVAAIVGMGGLGKTALAQLIYNNERVMAHFEKSIWVCVSDPFDVTTIAKKVIESMGGSTSNNPGPETLLCKLQEAVDKKRFLLVLDDVWDERGRLWEKLRVPLMHAAPGSKVVVTTRSVQAAEAMETTLIHNLGVLSDSDCWKLFKHKALKGTEDEECRELIEIGEKIVKRCKGIPLAVRALASLLRCRRNRWYWEHVLGSEIWEWLPENGGILPALLLSYYSLPLHLQRCFSFCSVFPKDHVIEKDELVKLWMAHGIIKSEKAKKDYIEELGEMYFDDLLTYSLFQDAEKDTYGNIVGCKMHDLVHDLARFVSSGDYCSMEAGDSELSSIKCHHLSLLVNDDVSSIPSPLCSAEHLRTLLLFGSSTIKEVPESLFNHLKFLRALDLSGTKIENLPSFLGKLKHLRYLDLSGSKITELPESATNLWNLQTLKLNCCWRLCLLPSGMSKMVKLRHLDLNSTGIKNLPSSLGNLKHLRYLDLSGLNITKLPESVTDLCNLQTLKLNSCRSLCLLPSGMTKMVKLRHLELEASPNLKVLPNGLGKLTSLRTLSQFPVGDENNKGCKIGELKNLNLLRGTLKIRNLEKLIINPVEAREAELDKKCHLQGLRLECDYKTKEEWEILGEGEMKRMERVFKGLRPPHSNLKFLSIEYYEGSKFPSWLEDAILSSLVTVRLENCRKCRLLPGLGKLPSLEELTLSEADEIKVVGGDFYGNGNDGRGKGIAFPKLKELEFTRMWNWEEWKLTKEDGEVMPSLDKLSISNCNKLKALPNCLPNTLRQIKIKDCSEVIWVPDNPLPLLEDLFLGGDLRGILGKPLPCLPALKKLQIWNTSIESLTSDGWGLLESLNTLEISDCQGLASLPNGLGQLKALQIVSISFCAELRSPFDGFEQLKSLHRLNISFCPKLRALANVQHFTALEELSIYKCPLVTERLEKEKGEDWRNISHIACIWIDGKRIQ